MFQMSYKELEECFNEVSRKFQGSLKGVSRNIEECFKGVFRGFHGYLKKIKGNFREGSNVFQGWFTKVSRAFQESY